MENVNWVEMIVAILTGIATCIPLVIKLIQTVRESAKSKNWTALMQLVLKLMTEAEANFSTGAEKKAYVLDSIEAIKDTLNYDVDMDAVSAMIDSIIIASKQINIKVEQMAIAEKTTIEE